MYLITVCGVRNVRSRRATSGVFDKQVDRKPPRRRYGLNRAPEEAADEKMAAVTDLDLQAPALHAAGDRVISPGEMTGLQALERKQPTMPMGPGRVERRECEYIRHGTLTLIAHCDVAPGQVVAPSRGPTRTEEDFGAQIMRTVASAPKATRWHVVMDHWNMHQSASLVRLVAKDDKLQEDLGQKDKRGILQSRATRTALLSAPTHGMVCHYTPQHASGMNQSDMWFSMLVRKLLKRASCTSVEELQAQVLAFIEYFTATMAKPFKWTYGRKPLSV